ncbi:MAG: Rpn family recombination-promoting nuclease/putative transposase [Xanthomonadales bacterium]|jgi:predicted transposase YdaD|nr:Rpn family recombination-promoting nuclease/putative transposase [Xanthomonadales bacterium]
MRHDAAYKRLFSHPELVADLLRACVTDAWAEDLDYSTLERIDTSSVDPKLDQRHSDVVWRLKWLGEDWLYVYLLLEFQSKPDRWMPLRMLQYVVGCYDQLRRSGVLRERDALPPVLPVVLYRGSRRWTSPISLAGMRPKLPPALEALQPQLKTLLIDEAEHQGDPDSPVANLARLIFRIEHSGGPEDVAQVLTEAQALLSESKRRSLRESLFVWLTRVYLPDQLPDVEWTQIVELAEVPEMLGRRRLTWGEQWKRDALKEGRQEGRLEGRQEGRLEGRQEGRLEGRQEGRLEGRQEGQRETLCETLQSQTRKRFGPEVALQVAERLPSIGSNARLRQLTEDFLDCTTAEQWLAMLAPDADAA